jgi:hypothetical protein
MIDNAESLALSHASKGHFLNFNLARFRSGHWWPLVANRRAFRRLYTGRLPPGIRSRPACRDFTSNITPAQLIEMIQRPAAS